ncbi:MAG TPA: YbaK/EbsC family protein [Pseudonocardiaceae bacterium]|jgi:prolyl-tRNA editing enzyme YbaK/EbsC (Cys-tRNA(Pro) deacylase)|nr:YbaK/EbsC family protein [Pseudonocardiaceae bacterium]
MVVGRTAGRLDVRPALDAPELLAEPVAAALTALPAQQAARCTVAEIDPALADTAALCQYYEVPVHASANCVVVTGKRAGVQRWAGCVVLATTRADVNGVVRRWLDVRKASFATRDEVVELTLMEYGGITPLGLPAGWPVLLDAAVIAADQVVVGSGLRRSKLLLPGEVLAALPGAEIIDGLGRPVH